LSKHSNLAGGRDVHRYYGKLNAEPVIDVEDLNAGGMVKNRHPAAAISDTPFV